MTRYLLDTTALIDFSKGREPAQSRILAMINEGSEVGVCAINLTEFYAGIMPERPDVWQDFFASLEYYVISRSAAIKAGALRYMLGRQGQQISTTDALIAAVALEQHAVRVTDNSKHYPIDNLHLASVRN